MGTLYRAVSPVVHAVTIGVAPLLAAELPDDVWLESWFHPSRLASEAGITRFGESPMLAAKVAAGAELPGSGDDTLAVTTRSLRHPGGAGVQSDWRRP